MTRRVVWLQVLIGWLPLWGIFAALIYIAHGRPFIAAAHGATRMMITGALLGVLVHHLTERVPWPRPFRVSFLFIHLVAAAVYAMAWLALNVVVELVVRGTPTVVAVYALSPYPVLGVWLYVMVAGVSYSSQTADRAARAEAAAAQAQLAALRSQLNPHFLFNALHTVVQLIPREPVRAGEAAEELAGLLREAMAESRDLVTLGHELAFVEKYLSLEHMRFGERLRVHVNVPEEARQALLPSFAIQTLVENAVRHGAGPRVEPTDVRVEARLANDALHVVVSDTGAGASAPTDTAGTGLRRLEARLTALYRGAARLDAAPQPGGGFRAALVVPQPNDD